MAACLLARSGLAADPTVEKLAVKRIYPAGAAAGTTIVVKAEGTFPRWPVRVWTDRPGTTWTPRGDKGSFDVAVAESNSAGVHRLRIHDDREAAELRHFVVGTVPEVLEVEPNDWPVEPQAVARLPITINGVLEKPGDVDGYAVQLDAGQTLVAAVDAHGGPAAPLDAVLEVVDEQGRYFARNLDACGLDPRIVFRPSRAGRYVVRVYGFPSTPNQTIGYVGGIDQVYRLSLTIGGFVAATLPAAISRANTPAMTASGWNLPAGLPPVQLGGVLSDDQVWATFSGIVGTVPLPVVDAVRLPVVSPDGIGAPVEPPLVASGLLTAPDQSLALEIVAKKSQPLLVAVEANAVGSEAEAVLEIRDAEGRSLLTKSDRDPAAVWTPPADARYRAAVRDRRGGSGPGHFWRVLLLAAAPEVVATCASDAIAGTVAGTMELPITVERRRGWKEAVEFRLVDPPPGLTAAPVISAVEGESAKKCTLSLRATVPWSGPLAVAAFRVAPQSTGERVTAVRFGGEKLPHVWVSAIP